MGLITGFKLCCCPQTDILKLSCNWKKTQEITTPKQQEMKTMERRPKNYKTIKYSEQNQHTTSQPDFDHTP